MEYYKGEKSCVAAFYNQIRKDGAEIPDILKIRCWVWFYLKNSIQSSSVMSSHWTDLILKETHNTHKESVSKTFDDFSAENIKDKYPEYCL